MDERIQNATRKCVEKILVVSESDTRKVQSHANLREIATKAAGIIFDQISSKIGPMVVREQFYASGNGQICILNHLGEMFLFAQRSAVRPPSSFNKKICMQIF